METEWINGVESILLANGTWVPIIKGGSGVDTLVQGQDDTDEDDDDFEDEDYDDEDYDDDDEDDDDLEASLSEGFLRGVPEEHREILAPYVKKWDAGVTRRFQELHSQYAPYQELGEIEQIQQALEVMQYLQESPEELYQLLHEQYGEQGLQEPVPEGTPQVPGAIPPEYEQRMNQLQSVVELMAQDFVEKQRMQAEAQEDEELESYLDNLREEFGDFDETWVLTKMQAGMDGEKAVKSFMRLRQDIINQALESQEDVPVLLSGGGSSSGAEKPQKLGDIPNKDVQGFVAGLLAQANQAAS